MNLTEKLCMLDVEFKHTDKDKWSKGLFGPFKNHYGAMSYYDAIIKPRLEFGANVITRPVENPGQSFGMNTNEWMKQFS